MQLEEYFDFLSADDIRIKGPRVGIETVLYDFIHRSRSAEEIAASYPSVTLEQVYATILYYVRNRKPVERYLEKWLEWGKRMREAQDRNPPPVVVRLRAAKPQPEAAQAPA